jgi:hypothetical protein
METFVTPTDEGPRFEIHSRPWGLAIFGVALACYLLVVASADTTGVDPGMDASDMAAAAVIASAFAAFGWLARRRTLIADADGIRARAFGEWVSYRWDEMLDVSWMAIPSMYGPRAVVEVRPAGSAGAVPGPNWPDEVVAFWFIGRLRSRAAAVAFADLAAHYGVPATAMLPRGVWWWAKVTTYRGGSSVHPEP